METPKNQAVAIDGVNRISKALQLISITFWLTKSLLITQLGPS